MTAPVKRTAVPYRFAWQLLPAHAPDFEESALRACQLIAECDPRIGEVPKPRKSRARV